MHLQAGLPGLRSRRRRGSRGAVPGWAMPCLKQGRLPSGTAMTEADMARVVDVVRSLRR